MTPQRRERLGSVFLPGFDVHICNATPDLAKVGPRVGDHGAARSQVFDRDVDCLVHARRWLGDRELGQRSDFEERPDHAAMQGWQKCVPDQMGRERQDGGHLVASQFSAHAEEAYVGNALEKGFKLLG